jgi:hypothetical protein
MTEKKVMTREEEADEIIRRLSTPPVKKSRRIEAEWTFEQVDVMLDQYGVDLEKEIAEIIASAIDEEILKEIEELEKWQKKHLST